MLSRLYVGVYLYVNVLIPGAICEGDVHGRLEDWRAVLDGLHASRRNEIKLESAH